MRLVSQTATPGHSSAKYHTVVGLDVVIIVCRRMAELRGSIDVNEP
jgi:hypothetical protein